MVELFNGTYCNKKVLITGNTGFKGSWLALWLQQMGANVTGLSNEEYPNTKHFDALQLDYPTLNIDINEQQKVIEAVQEVQPDIIFHLAAQSLVRESYRDPLTTYSTNIIGTLNVFEAARHASSVKAIVNVTTDKVYENKEQDIAYVEGDELGGFDLYSSSKACVEILTNSYKRAFFEGDRKVLVAAVRAGNVIGGGDDAADRLIPDIIRATVKEEIVFIRNPYSVRPWQHVLEPLSGYLLVGQKLLNERADCATPWNFGPEDSSCIEVQQVTQLIHEGWNSVKFELNKEEKTTFHEAKLLKLNSNKAKNELQWTPVWSIQETLAKTIGWYKDFELNAKINSFDDLNGFVADASAKNAPWC